MSNDLVIFNVRCEKNQVELKINASSDFTEFIEKLKYGLEVDDENEIVILCPTSDGKMMEINSNEDIEFLKKTKLCYNAISKEIYCNVELVVIVIYPQVADNLNDQFKILSNKVNQLSSLLTELSCSLNNKIEENASRTLESIRSMLFECLQGNSDNQQKNISLGEQNSSRLTDQPKTGQRKKKPMTDKEKKTATHLNSSNNNSLNSSESLIQPKKTENSKIKDIDTLLEMLKNDGFTNAIQNIIVLKRFDNDYEKAITYLKVNSTEKQL